MIGNGGFGAVHKSLQSGIPIVVAGEGQDKATVEALTDYFGVESISKCDSRVQERLERPSKKSLKMRVMEPKPRSLVKLLADTT